MLCIHKSGIDCTENENLRTLTTCFSSNYKNDIKKSEEKPPGICLPTIKCSGDLVT